MPTQSPDLNLRIRRILDQQGRTIAEASRDVVKNFASPPVGSPAWKDREWANQNEHAELVRGSYVAAAQTVTILLRTMEEYRQGILALLDNDKMLALPTLSCVRAMHDAALRIGSLSDVPAAPAGRIRVCRRGGSTRRLRRSPLRLDGQPFHRRLR